MRPKEVHLKGYDLDGNEVSIEADELLARAFQHEMDHLDGVLFIERLDDDTRKAAMKIIREQRLTAADLADADLAAPARSRRRLQPSLSRVTLAVPPEGPIRRVAYLGTPELAVPPLRALVDDGVDVALVVSQPDRRRGRGSDLVPSPVKAAALELGLPVTDRVDDVLDADVPLGVVVAFGRLIKPHVLEAVPMVNLHFSLLPRWRGAAPVERAILAGDERTGVDLMAVEEGLDTGGTYRRTEVPIGPDDTLEELRGRPGRRGHPAARRPRCREGLGDPTPQVGRADLRRQAHRRGPPPRLERVRPSTSTAACASATRGRRTTASASRCGARTSRRAATARGSRAADGEVELVEVQPEGKGRMDAKAWANGARWHARRPARHVTHPRLASSRSTPSTASSATAPTPTCSSPSCSAARRSSPATATSPPSSSTAPRG